MNYSCPHCQTPIGTDPAFAGQVVACPQCGGQFTMPDSEPLPPPTTHAHEPYRPPITQPIRWQKPHNPIKVLMIVATLLWPLAMVGWGILVFGTTAGHLKPIPGIGGHYYDSKTAKTYSEREIFTMKLTAAMSSGICCPTVPYAVAMVILSVMYFATKQ